jgi:MFS family permease
MTAKEEFRAHWKVVLASAVGFGLGMSGLPIYTNGVFLPEITQEFGWSFARVQTSSMVTGLSILITAPIMGWLTDKVGPKPVTVTSLLAFGLSYMLLSRLNGDYTLFLLTWALIALSGSGTQATVWTRTVATWFSSGRGMALGLTLLGTGVSAIIAPSAAAWLVGASGWRTGYLLLGALPLVIALPLVVWLLPNRKAVAAQRAKAVGVTPREAFRDWRYWLIGGVLFVIAITVAGLIPNLVKMALMQGLTRSEGAALTGAIGLFVVLGRLSCGYLLDRFWGPAVALAFFCALPLGCLLLSFDGIGVLGVGAAAALIGLAAAAEFDVIPYLIGRYFGTKRFGLLVGIINIFFALGAAFGPVMFGRVLDVTGSYDTILLIAAPLCLAASAMLLLLGRYPTFPPPDEPVAAPTAPIQGA